MSGAGERLDAIRARVEQREAWQRARHSPVPDADDRFLLEIVAAADALADAADIALSYPTLPGSREQLRSALAAYRSHGIAPEARHLPQDARDEPGTSSGASDAERPA